MTTAINGGGQSGDVVLNRFAGALLDPDIEIPDNLTDRQGDPAGKRYSVYRNNVVVSLTDALGAAYPSLMKIMGEDNFRRVSRNFLVSHPPRSALMLDYGAEFPAFLESFPPLRKSPFLADVARVERAWLESYHAADAAPISPQALARVPADQSVSLVFEPHPAAAIVESRWPVADLFAWRDGRPSDGADLEIAQCVAVSRPYLAVEVREISSADCRFLKALMAGQTLGDAAGLVAADGFDLSTAIALALEAGIFTAVQINPGQR